MCLRQRPLRRRSTSDIPEVECYQPYSPSRSPALPHVLVHETPPTLYTIVGQRQLMSSLRGTLRQGLALSPTCLSAAKVVS